MTMRNDCVYLVGIDIGGTKCAVSLGEYRESDACPVSLVDKIRFDTNNQAGHTDVIRRILDAVRNLLARQGWNRRGSPRRAYPAAGRLTARPA